MRQALLLLLAWLVPLTTPQRYHSTSASARTGRLPYTSSSLGHPEHQLLSVYDDHAGGTVAAGLRAGSHRVTTAHTVLPPMDSPPRGADPAADARAQAGAHLTWYTKYAAADAHVVCLPSRLRVIDVPAGVERRYDDFCARDAELGDRGSS